VRGSFQKRPKTIQESRQKRALSYPQRTSEERFRVAARRTRDHPPSIPKKRQRQLGLLPRQSIIMHRPSIARLAQHGCLVAELPPPYLAPSLHFSMTRSPQSSSFSTTPVAAGRGRDMNRTRGVSAIHRTGTRFKLSASRYPLPKPVAPADMQPQPPNPNHGLWGFFPKSREAMTVPEFDMDFGE
jgi:hypothetical protein